MKKVPSFKEAQDELGPDAMSFFMDMVNQGDDTGREQETADTSTLHNKDLPRPQSAAEARALPSGTHFVDPKGQRRKKA